MVQMDSETLLACDFKFGLLHTPNCAVLPVLHTTRLYNHSPYFLQSQRNEVHFYYHKDRFQPNTNTHCRKSYQNGLPYLRQPHLLLHGLHRPNTPLKLQLEHTLHNLHHKHHNLLLPRTTGLRTTLQHPLRPSHPKRVWRSHIPSRAPPPRSMCIEEAVGEESETE